MAVVSVGAILVLAAGVTTWLAWPEASRAPAANRSPFDSAVKNLAAAQGVRYQSTAVGGPASWDARVTTDGDAIGSLGLAGRKLGLLNLDGTTYLRSPDGVVPGAGLGDASPAALRGKWVTGSAGSLDSVLSQVMAPAKLAASLRRAMGGTTRFPAPDDAGTPINGVLALKASTPSGDLFVSKNAPHRVLRFEPRGHGAAQYPRLPRLPRLTPALEAGRPVASAPEPSSSPSPPLGEMNIDPQSAPEVDKTYQDLTDSARQLSNSVDTSIEFKLRGGPGNISCGASGCTLTATTMTSVSATGEARVTGGTVTAQLTATMSINGMPAGSCTRSAPLPLNGIGAISCSNPAAGAVFVQADAAAKARARATARPGTIYRWTVTSRASVRILALAQVKVGQLVEDLQNKRGDAAEAGGMDGVRDKGREGEAAAGIVKNTDRIPSASGTAAYRIPDELGRGVIGEVKNVSYLSYTNQLRDFAAYAQQQGLRFNLYVRGSTRLSGPLQAAVDSGAINLVRNLP